ncbi:sulfotransferase domain-containing protein [Tabrizicola sp.]|uniref:sulfotransferase domain-containing protein n=1 Tax=Tabrizicola sp. TaxID=2005166 RepID=UPI003F31924D
MTQTLPSRSREYRNYGFESRNWDLVTPRDGDVVISTSYKSGTTWMQNIVLQMIFRGGEAPAVADVSPWVDRRREDPAPMAATLAAQTHRRVMKSHLSLEALPYHAGTRYIVCVRDARDVFMSLWNHLSQMSPAVIEMINASPARVGEPMPGVGADIHAFWAGWINRGWFPWETEGYPHSANMGHTQSWWNFRHLPNILFVHFADLLADPAAEVRRVAGHLGITLSDRAVAGIVEATTFTALRENGAKTGPMPVEGANQVWPEGLKTFFHKGTNGRWREVLTPEELEMYEAAKLRVLTPDCAAYTELGRKALVSELAEPR